VSIDDAIRLTEILMGFAFAQQSIEHFVSKGSERYLFIFRFILAVLLIVGFHTTGILVILLLLALEILYRFQGPYNGGADRMSLLILSCLCLAQLSPTQYWKEIAFGYLALQLVLSYFISGFVKVVNPEWRNGQALCDVFLFSVYPASESLRNWANWPRLLFFMSWGVMLFELLFPISLISSTSLYIALIIAASFHLSNVFMLGLNRFFWIWISAYPSIIWFQQRIFTMN